MQEKPQDRERLDRYRRRPPRREARFDPGLREGLRRSRRAEGRRDQEQGRRSEGPGDRSRQRGSRSRGRVRQDASAQVDRHRVRRRLHRDAAVPPLSGERRRHVAFAIPRRFLMNTIPVTANTTAMTPNDAHGGTPSSATPSESAVPSMIAAAVKISAPTLTILTSSPTVLTWVTASALSLSTSAMARSRASLITPEISSEGGSSR